MPYEVERHVISIATAEACFVLHLYSEPGYYWTVRLPLEGSFSPRFFLDPI